MTDDIGTMIMLVFIANGIAMLSSLLTLCFVMDVKSFVRDVAASLRCGRYLGGVDE